MTSYVQPLTMYALALAEIGTSRKLGHELFTGRDTEYPLFTQTA